MASTITRDVWVNDSGTAANPAGDGTIINNAALQNNIYARIDEMFAGAGAYSTFTFGGRLAVEGFGSHTFNAGGTGFQFFQIRNTTSGTANGTRFALGNDASGALLDVYAFSSTFSTSGSNVASGVAINANGTGGLSINASDASGVIRFYAASVERARLTTAGAWRVADGSVSEPSLSFLSDTDTGFWFDPSSEFVALAHDGAESVRFSKSSGIIMPAGDRGNGALPPGIVIGANNNVTTGVAGYLQLGHKNGSTASLIWADTSGNLKIGSSANLVADAGTVVGTQSSSRETKTILETFEAYDDALALIRSTPLYRFTYKNGAYHDSEFLGPVAEEAPQLMMDNNQSFNPVSAFGYSAAAIKALARRVDALERARFRVGPD